MFVNADLCIKFAHAFKEKQETISSSRLLPGRKSGILVW